MVHQRDEDSDNITEFEAKVLFAGWWANGDEVHGYIAVKRLDIGEFRGAQHRLTATNGPGGRGLNTSSTGPPRLLREVSLVDLGQRHRAADRGAGTLRARLLQHPCRRKGSGM
jgi:hypothetical protein